MYCGLMFQIWMEYHVSLLSYGLFLVKNVITLEYHKEKGTLQAKLGDVSVVLGMVYDVKFIVSKYIVL